jgi:hypothetical protein
MPVRMEQTERSKISAYKIQMLGNHSKEIIQQSEHRQILKSITHYNFFVKVQFEFNRLSVTQLHT